MEFQRKTLSLNLRNCALNKRMRFKEYLMNNEKTEITNDDIRAVFDPMFNTGHPQHR